MAVRSKHSFYSPEYMERIVEFQRNSHKDPCEIIEELEERAERLWRESPSIDIPLSRFIRAFVNKHIN